MTIAKVTPASVAPVATDEATVVTFSPNCQTAKGTQPAQAVPTQDLKDSGRVAICWTLDSFPTAAVAETLMTMTESRDGAAVTTFTSKVITNGKRLRLTHYMYTVENGGSTPVQSRLKVRIRVNAGAVTTASPIQHLAVLSAGPTVRAVDHEANDFPDGLEFLGDGTKQIGVTVESPEFVTTTQLPVAHLSLYGYEY